MITLITALKNVNSQPIQEKTVKKTHKIVSQILLKLS